jgi:hypothetical protein
VVLSPISLTAVILRTLAAECQTSPKFGAKNDKRDAANLAVLHRGGLLTAVWVPDAAHEAMRDLIRTRLAAVALSFEGVCFNLGAS